MDSPYTRFARYYDLENAALTEDIPFWLELAHTAGGPVLELGCGTGRISLQLAREGFEVVGVDNSPEMLARARAKLALSPTWAGRIDWSESDFTRMDLARTFPLIIAPFNTFTHLTDRETIARALSAAVRHMAPGGQLAFDLPNPAAVYGGEPAGLVLERTFADEERGVTVQQFSTLHLDRLAQLGHVTWMYDETDSEGRLSRTTIPMTLRYFFPAELETIITAHGMRLDALYGDFDRSPLEEDSPKLIVVAQKS